MTRLSLSYLTFCIAILCATAPAYAMDVATGSCKPRGAVAVADRQPYEQAALEFASLLVSGEVALAHARMAGELQSYVPLDTFMASVKPDIEPFKKLGALHVAQSYLVESALMTGSGQFVLCAAGANLPMSSPQARVFVLAKPIPQQAHVVIEGTNQDGIWTFSVWMIPVQGTWRVMGFYAALPPAMGVAPSDIWALATSQQRKGHSLNAYLLFGVVSQLTYRGPNFQLGLWADSQSELKGLKLPPEVQGRPPFTWHLGSSTFRVLDVSLKRDNGNTLSIAYQPDSAGEPAQIDEQNHRFIRELKTYHPDFLDGFDAVEVSAMIANGHTLNTVEKLP